MPPVDENAEALRMHWQAVDFRCAVEQGNMEKVENMLNPKEGVPFPATYKMTDGSSWTILMIAADAGQRDMVERFTKAPRMPKVEEKDPHGFQALMLGALKGHRDICEILIEKKAEVNAQDNDGETSLMKAAAMGHTEVVRLLLEKGADPDSEDCNSMSAIKKACSAGHVDCLKELLPKVKDDARQLKHCLLFGRLNGHEDVIEEMTKTLEPKGDDGDAPKLGDAEGAVSTGK
mmetsp:Transcript_88379/g.248992  ORF Transcript_88379/g.248992 Transcript_88379/m.248992 type:complete len:233 (+) Transcript_88379:108-806(+)|eukprot:CAMPEP_0117548058 /NCGR_PEP_ID=MMETSP0784-20121206/47455_1 /TAXON_ID=39447 /ORGANISM="" /LENGTH=232 /DNA_ID=CAMNT_0005345005 /DNA_START=96 /DNA_END=794 /DNA_ORIENTATION=-